MHLLRHWHIVLFICLCGASHTLKSQSNYQYDAAGRLISDLVEGVVKIEWNNKNKVTRIIRADTSHLPDLEFAYDAHGNRISKLVKPRSGTGLLPESNWTYTYYIHNGGNHSVAAYARQYSADDDGTYDEQFKIEELSIEANKRHGLYKPSEDILVNYFFNAEFDGSGQFLSRQEKEVIVAPPAINLITNSRGRKCYELENHQENILTTLSDRNVRSNTNPDYIAADMLSSVDYYPFGMEIPGRIYNAVPYRYGFNGKEKDNELKGEGNSIDFGARFYDPRLGRFLSLDAMAGQYASHTPYQYSLNSPLMFRDPDGNAAKYTVIRNENGGGTIVISANIFVVGINKEHQIPEMRAGVSHFYKDGSYVDDKTGEKFVIKFNINISSITKMKREVVREDNVIVVQSETGSSSRSHAEPGVRLINVTVENQGKLIGQTVAHEIGHLVGLTDRYFETDPAETNANAIHTKQSLADIKSGKIDSDLMGAIPQEDMKPISLNRTHYNNLGRYILEHAALRDNLPNQKVERSGYILYPVDLDEQDKLIGGLLSERDEFNRRSAIGAGLAARRSYEADAARRARQKDKTQP